jgi:AhpD family alkylhydroperoxidase
MPNPKLISPAFQAFLDEAPQHAQAWMDMVRQLSAAGALDAKTQALCYLAVLAVLQLNSGIAFHVAQARKTGASRTEIISAILIGLPAAGHCVTQALPVALKALEDQAVD